MKKKKGNQIVNSSEYVREPVDKEVNSILNLEINKVILTGGRGVGKTTVLCALENRGLGSNEQTIYMCPEPAITVSKEPDKFLNENAFRYLYELRFANSILNYIKKNYPIVYEKYFDNDRKFVHNLLDEVFAAINNMGYKESTINCKYGTNDLVVGIMSKFIRLMDVQKINLALDRFDQVNGSSEYVQKLYERYFDLFDKVIIATDDDTIDSADLGRKGYDVRTIDYGKDEDVLCTIIKNRESLYADNKRYIELFTSKSVLDRLSVFGSNIDNALYALYKTIDYIHVYDDDVVKALDEAIKDVIKETTDLQEMMGKTKLYL